MMKEREGMVGKRGSCKVEGRRKGAKREKKKRTEKKKVLTELET